MFYGGSVSPPRQPANKKRVVPRRSATATTMASGDEKTPPGSPKTPFGGKGGEDAESSGKGEIVRVVREFGGAPNWPVLTKTNYTAWTIKMEAILNAQGLWEVVSSASGAEVDVRRGKTARAHLLQALPEASPHKRELKCDTNISPRRLMPYLFHQMVHYRTNL